MNDALTQATTRWAEKLRLEDNRLAELVLVMSTLPEDATETILAGTLCGDRTEIGFCADSLVIYNSVIRSGDRQKHLLRTVDSLLALVPELAETYFLFSSRGYADEFLVHDAFTATHEVIRERLDFPSDYLFRLEDDEHLLPFLRGYMISFLTTRDVCEHDDARWLGENYRELAPYAGTMFERGDCARDFCEHLIAQGMPVMAQGML